VPIVFGLLHTQDGDPTELNIIVSVTVTSNKPQQTRVERRTGLYR